MILVSKQVHSNLWGILRRLLLTNQLCELMTLTDFEDDAGMLGLSTAALSFTCVLQESSQNQEEGWVNAGGSRSGSASPKRSLLSPQVEESRMIAQRWEENHRMLVIGILWNHIQQITYSVMNLIYTLKSNWERHERTFFSVKFVLLQLISFQCESCWTFRQFRING